MNFELDFVHDCKTQKSHPNFIVSCLPSLTGPYMLADCAYLGFLLFLTVVRTWFSRSADIYILLVKHCLLYLSIPWICILRCQLLLGSGMDKTALRLFISSLLPGLQDHESFILTVLCIFVVFTFNIKLLPPLDSWCSHAPAAELGF